MKGYSNKTRTRLKIIGATATAIFSLASVFTGTYAWFALSSNVTATGMQITVATTRGARIDKVRLIKFDYAPDGIGGYDYLNPYTGSVNAYDFNETEGTFGYFERTTGTGNYSYANGKYTKEDTYNYDYTWVVINSMNVYDPVEKVIRGNSFDLRALNCNVIYEITFSSNLTGDFYLQSSSFRDENKTKRESEIYLTSCIDFDAFYTDDISAAIGSENGKPLYYPSYISYDAENPYLGGSEGSIDEIYYRLSYWASTKNSHANYYSTNPMPTSISIDSNAPMSFASSSDSYTVYINANYAPDRLTDFVKKIYSGNVTAVYDYNFSFDFSSRQGAKQ